ncbi:MAG: hypothetical protein ACLTTU_00400, partial [Bilophila wadsworthia]
PMQQLFLKKHEDRRLRAGHLWIFSNEVDVKRSPLTAFAPGEAAQVCAADGRTIGTAYVNPASLIAARIVSRKADEPLDAALIKKRLERALQLRETLFDVPFYRRHGEGDWLPGLVLDRYGDAFSAQITTAGTKPRRMPCLKCSESCSPPKPCCSATMWACGRWKTCPCSWKRAWARCRTKSKYGKAAQPLPSRWRKARRPAGSTTSAPTGWRPPSTPRARPCSTPSATRARSGSWRPERRGGRDVPRRPDRLGKPQPAANAGCPGETLPGDAGYAGVPARRGRKFGVVASIPAFIKRKKDASTPTAGSTIWACNSWKTGVLTATNLRSKRCAA